MTWYGKSQPGVGGKLVGRRVLVSLIVLCLASGGVFAFFPPGNKLQALAFLQLALCPLALVYLLPVTEGRTRQALLIFFLPIPPAALFLWQLLHQGGEILFFFQFWILCVAVLAATAGAMRILEWFAGSAQSAMPWTGLLLCLWFGGVWLCRVLPGADAARFFFQINPFSSLAGLLGFDWLRTGKLYSQFPLGSGEPFRYPGWDVFSLAAFLAGVGLLILAEAAPRRAVAPKNGELN